MNQQQVRCNRQSGPQRWQAALCRALEEGVTVRQVNANGMWVAASGTDRSMAYLLEITGGIVHSCTCPAGQHGDPVCKHRAQWYFNAGLLSLDNDTPEPAGPALGNMIDCPDCNGCGIHYSRELERLGLLYPSCRLCGGTGMVAAPALRPAA
jgi:hypothetical protein